METNGSVSLGILSVEVKNYSKQRQEISYMKKIQTIGVAGAGAMGRGIAQIAAQAGF